jgi:hypothetical protein
MSRPSYKLCVITFLILFPQHTRVCISLVLEPVPRKSQDVIIILSSLRLGNGHVHPRERTDGCFFWGRTDASVTPDPPSVIRVRSIGHGCATVTVPTVTDGH